MQKRERLYEGKAKKVYATDDARFYIIEYKDDATAFNGTIAGKGVVNNRMSNILFRMLEANGVETHFVEELNDRDTVVKAVKIVPLEVIVRNVAAGSFSKRFGVEEGRTLLMAALESPKGILNEGRRAGRPDDQRLADPRPGGGDG